MKIEAVITCVNYSDFLSETLPHNRAHFDRLVVVTAPEDSATRRVCEYWNVECIPTDAFETRWGRFCKGKGINVGLAALSKSDWVMHMDADIVLPPLARTLIQSADLDPTHMYGFDRHVCRGAEQWRAFLALPQLQHEDNTWVHLDKLPLSPRFIKDGAYTPIGFAQLWHPATSKVHAYPERHGAADRTDVKHALNWPAGKRSLVPSVIVYHLESDDAAFGVNWSGRKSAHFGSVGKLSPPVVPPTCPVLTYGDDGQA